MNHHTQAFVIQLASQLGSINHLSSVWLCIIDELTQRFARVLSLLRPTAFAFSSRQQTTFPISKSFNLILDESFLNIVSHYIIASACCRKHSLMRPWTLNSNCCLQISIVDSIFKSKPNSFSKFWGISVKWLFNPSTFESIFQWTLWNEDKKLRRFFRGEYFISSPSKTSLFLCNRQLSHLFLRYRCLLLKIQCNKLLLMFSSLFVSFDIVFKSLVCGNSMEKVSPSRKSSLVQIYESLCPPIEAVSFHASSWFGEPVKCKRCFIAEPFTCREGEENDWKSAAPVRKTNLLFKWTLTFSSPLIDSLLSEEKQHL